MDTIKHFGVIVNHAVINWIHSTERKIVICRDAIVGAATSRPQRNGTARLVEWHAIRTHCRGGSQPPAFVPGQKCSVEWYHVRHSTNSPNLIRYCGFVPRGRLRASPTVLSWCCGNSPNPVHHFWLVPHGRLVAAPTKHPYKLQFPVMPSCCSGGDFSDGHHLSASDRDVPS